MWTQPNDRIESTVGRDEVSPVIEDFKGTFGNVTRFFSSMCLKPELLRAMQQLGIKQPKGIQKRAIVPATHGRDVIMQSKWDSGKTTALGIAVLNRVDPALPHVQAIIITPSRVLAQETAAQVTRLSAHQSTKVCAFIGGTSTAVDEEQLKRRGVHVGVGTIGRVTELIRREVMATRHLRLIVIDEADVTLSPCEVFDKGGSSLKLQMYALLDALPDDIQIIVSCSSMPLAVEEMTSRFANNPIRIVVDCKESPLDGVRQFYVAIEKEEYKCDRLIGICQAITEEKIVVLCDKADTVEMVAGRLGEKDFVVASVHGNMDLAKREEILEDFTTGSARILVACDHYKCAQAPLVINFNLPAIVESYAKRARPVQTPVGRRGKGVIVNLVTATEDKTMKEIEKMHNVVMEEMPATVSEVLHELL